MIATDSLSNKRRGYQVSMSVEAWAIVATVVLALLGYIVTHAHDLRLAQRKDRLERVNRQLSELYGPLYAANGATLHLWGVFKERHGLPGSTPSWWIDNVDVWRLWVTTVFMPLNVQMRDAVVQHADLLRHDGMPKSLLDLCAHVSGYETVLERWRREDFADGPRHNTSPAPHPHDALTAYIADAYEDLKREQSELLVGLKRTPRSTSNATPAQQELDDRHNERVAGYRAGTELPSGSPPERT